MRRIVSWLTIMLMAGCSSVPVSTMWNLRNFDPTDLARLEPADIRIASLIEPGPQRVDVERSRLVLRLIQHEGDDIVHRFALAEAGGHSAMQPGDHQRGWQDFGLDEQAIQAFRALQPSLTTIQDDYKGFGFGAELKLDGGMEGRPDRLLFTVRLRLAPDQNVLTLFDRAPMPVTYSD